MTNFISIIIPNYNGSNTIEPCLEAACSSNYDHFEVIVVDDCSHDNSVAIIKKFPCKLIQLRQHSGASRARNVGAAAHNQDGLLFFIDADCILAKDTLKIVSQSFNEQEPQTIIGGTYTPLPYDQTFYSIFQSIFINQAETKNISQPDYIASHAMVIENKIFKQSGGFPESFMPILEDVEFSHRLRKSGYKLIMSPEILVRHIFNFSLFNSLKNAIRKAKYWTAYSLRNQDMFSDSGTASIGLKINVLLFLLTIIILTCGILFKELLFPATIPLILLANFLVNRQLCSAFFTVGGAWFGCLALLYYSLIYPAAVGLGVSAGIIKYLRNGLK